jgi:hypothetical protein
MGDLRLNGWVVHQGGPLAGHEDLATVCQRHPARADRMVDVVLDGSWTLA